MLARRKNKMSDIQSSDSTSTFLFLRENINAREIHANMTSVSHCKSAPLLATCVVGWFDLVGWGRITDGAYHVINKYKNPPRSPWEWYPPSLRPAAPGPGRGPLRQPRQASGESRPHAPRSKKWSGGGVVLDERVLCWSTTACWAYCRWC